MFKILAERKWIQSDPWEPDGKWLYDNTASYKRGMSQLRGIRKPLDFSRTDPELDAIWTEFNLPRKTSFVSWRLVGYELQNGQWVEIDRFEGP